MRFVFKVFLEYSYFKKIKNITLKKLLYNNKMPTYAELIKILKDNQKRDYSHYTNQKLLIC